MRQTVNSSMISEIGYNPETLELEVVFKSGRTYVYYDVPAQIFANIQNIVKSNDSVGRYFHSNILYKYTYEEA